MPETALARLMYHEVLMTDEVRVRGLAAALRRRVRPGMVVLDAGAGTGWLAVLAARLGARRVYAVERAGIASVARDLIRRNGVSDRVVLLRDDVEAIRLPERADLLVSEMVGNLAWNEEFLGLLRAARRRLLRPGARVIPSRVGLRLVPVADLGGADPGPAARAVPEIDLSPVFRARIHRPILVRRLPRRRLALPRAMFVLDLERGSPPEYPWSASAEWRMNRGGPVAAFAGWVEGEWTTGVPFSTQRPTHWHPFVLPVSPGLRVRPGDRLRIEMTFASAERIVWRVGANGSTWSRHDAALADPAAAAGVRLRGGAVPHPTTSSRRRAEALAAIDGRRGFEEIVTQVKRRPAFRSMSRSALSAWLRRLIAEEEWPVSPAP